MNARGMTRLMEGLPYDPIVLTSATLQGQGIDIRAHLRTIVLSNAAGFTVKIPPAKGQGTRLLFTVGITITSNSYILSRQVSTDIFQGMILNSFGTTNVNGFIAGATDNTITLNGTTSGGYIGDIVELIDTIAGVWSVRGFLQAASSAATPFSHV